MKNELIKEYLQIFKDGTDVGLNPPSAVHGPLEYFEKKICDLGDELLSLDEKLTDSKNQLTEMENRLEEVTKEVKETGMNAKNLTVKTVLITHRMNFHTMITIFFVESRVVFLHQ